MAVERSPVEWALLPLQRYATFKGRAPRAEYWWFYLGTIVAGIVAGIVDEIIGGSDVGWFSGLVNLLLLIPTIAVTVRRLHDTGRSGWWLLIGIALMVWLGYLAVTASLGGGAGFSTAMLAAVILTVIAGITLLVLMVTRGDFGPNRYGADPYAPNDHLEQIFA